MSFSAEHLWLGLSSSLHTPFELITFTSVRQPKLRLCALWMRCSPSFSNQRIMAYKISLWCPSLIYSQLGESLGLIEEARQPLHIGLNLLHLKSVNGWRALVTLLGTLTQLVLKHKPVLHYCVRIFFICTLQILALLHRKIHKAQFSPRQACVFMRYCYCCYANPSHMFTTGM